MMQVLALAMFLFALATGLTTAGVWLLVGMPWALIAAGAWALIGGVVLLRGVVTSG
ncbi:hypothetical protein [Ponticaulis profundi]|uniref:Uncharacterized protein n=1 Tax=Ponticaulis profundi TaxID=2665222 RepID=A0ABW1S9A7_9PROT